MPLLFLFFNLLRIFARKMPKLYVISGCNGAGKTTASYTVLPEVLGCKEFVNADEIARGLSPFNPESVAIDAGRLMLARMHGLIREGADFAFETTLSTRSYVKFIQEAREQGYFVVLLYFWLPSPELAIERVAQRVKEGGHNIPTDVIRRRYAKGLYNLTRLYTPICDFWAIYDNNAADEKIRRIASGERDKIIHIYTPEIKGKEKRKKTPSKAGYLGLEGMSAEWLEKALAPYADGAEEKTENALSLTKADFYELGLSGGERSAEKRVLLARALGLPSIISASSLIYAVNTLVSEEEFAAALEKVAEESL